MINLIRNEWLRRYRAPLVFTIIVAAMVLISMMFFRTISENMFLLDTFLSSGMMNGILGAFGVNVAAMKSVVGFFATYCTMWVMMAGGIYFAYFGAEILAREERVGTISYLALKPFSRVRLYAAKWFTLQLAILLFFICISVVGAISIQGQSRYAPWSIVKEALTEDVTLDISENSVALSQLIEVDEALFDAFTSQMLMGQFTGNEAEIEEAGIDAKGLMDALGPELETPELLFEKMLADPATYLTLFKEFAGDNAIFDMDEAKFVENIKLEQEKYRAMKADFLEGGDVIGHYYSYMPSFFLDYLVNSDRVEDAINAVPSLKKVFEKVSWTQYGYVIFNMWSVVSALGTLGMAIAAMTTKAQLSGQLAMILSLIFYFANSVIEMAKRIDWLKWLTPFGYADTSGETLNGFNMIVLLLLMEAFWLVGMQRYRRRDL